MTTDQLGPLVEGPTRRSRPAAPDRCGRRDELRGSFVRNLGYFWVGRFGGVAGVLLPRLLALVLFLAAGPRDADGWLAVAALVVSYLFYIWMIPDNWYGGGGTVGNRYFLNLLPLRSFFLPARREPGRGWRGAAALRGLPGARSGWHPLRALAAARATTRCERPFRLLPPELTMLNDLSVFTEAWRKKQPYGDTEGDPHKHWPADPKAYYLYFTDDGTYGAGAARWAAEGFWLRGGEPAEVVLRALEPVRRMTMRASPAARRATSHGRACGGTRGADRGRPGETRRVRVRSRRRGSRTTTRSSTSCGCAPRVRAPRVPPGGPRRWARSCRSRWR